MLFSSRKSFLFPHLFFAINLCILSGSRPVEQPWLTARDEGREWRFQYVHLYIHHCNEITEVGTVGRILRFDPHCRILGRALTSISAFSNPVQPARTRDLLLLALCTACRLSLTTWRVLRRVSIPAHHTHAMKGPRLNSMR